MGKANTHNYRYRQDEVVHYDKRLCGLAKGSGTTLSVVLGLPTSRNVLENLKYTHASKESKAGVRDDPCVLSALLPLPRSCEDAPHFLWRDPQPLGHALDFLFLFLPHPRD